MDAQAFISLGGTGILAYIMWQFSTSFLKTLNTQVDARIAALELRTAECERDRLKLHEQVVSILERNTRVDIAREIHSGQPSNVIVTNMDPIKVRQT